MVTQNTTEKMIDVVMVFLDDKPKGLMTETDLMNYRGRIWWDYIERYSISRSDYEKDGGSKLSDIYWKYHKK